MATINIFTLDKAAVFAALFNNAVPSAPHGFRQYRHDDISVETARQAIKQAGTFHFEYPEGRVLKVNLTEDLVNVDVYDSVNGARWAESVIDQLRDTGSVAHLGGEVEKEARARAVAIERFPEQARDIRDWGRGQWGWLWGVRLAAGASKEIMSLDGIGTSEPPQPERVLAIS